MCPGLDAIYCKNTAFMPVDGSCREEIPQAKKKFGKKCDFFAFWVLTYTGWEVFLPDDSGKKERVRQCRRRAWVALRCKGWVAAQLRRPAFPEDAGRIIYLRFTGSR